MNTNLRTFIAIKINPAPKLLEVTARCRELFENEAIRWVGSNNLHLTLKFLGETSEKQVQEIITNLENMAAQVSPFSLQLNGLGYFESGRQPKVLFAGVQELEEMKTLAQKIEEDFVLLGFEQEERKFNPHLTLGRIKFLKDKKRFYSFVEKYKNIEFQTVQVCEIIFYKSILNPRGPEYVPLAIVQLKK